MVYLWQIVLFTILMVTLSYVSIALFVESDGKSRVSVFDERIAASVFVVLIMTISIAFRDVYYGPDSQAYYLFFAQYCFTSSYDLSFDYQTSFAALNAAMIWMCEPDYMIFGWMLLFAASCFAIPIGLSNRIQLFALIIVSIVGIELTSNILRQGISSAFMLLAFTWLRKRLIVAIPLAVVALALHPSAALILIAGGLALLPWRYFIVGVSALGFVIIRYSQTQTGIAFVDRFFYEMNKYSAIESSELYIRILSIVQLALPIICGRIALVGDRGDDKTAEDDWSFSLRMALTSAPFLTIPYFGYRYVYGLYMIVLFSNYKSIASRRSPAFEILLYASLSLTLAWAYGSTLVRSSAFLKL
jgi:hypothetical protein